MPYVPRYSDFKVRRDFDTNTLYVRFFGGQLDEVEVAIRENELRPAGGGWYEPVDVDQLADQILAPAREQIVEGSYIVVPSQRELSDNCAD
jgi:hypothetical protein